MGHHILCSDACRECSYALSLTLLPHLMPATSCWAGWSPSRNTMRGNKVLDFSWPKILTEIPRFEAALIVSNVTSLNFKHICLLKKIMFSSHLVLQIVLTSCKCFIKTWSEISDNKSMYSITILVMSCMNNSSEYQPV